MDLSIITVTLNSKNFIAEQMRSVVLACGDLVFEQIIIDNGSSDATVEIVEDVENIGDVRMIANKTNSGFGIANNQGAEIAKGDFILFLNPDMKFVEKNILAKAIVWMRNNSKAGIMSCKLIDEAGNINVNEGPRRFPKVWEQMALVLKLPHIFPQFLSKYHYSDIDLNTVQEVDSVRGSFMLVRREIVEKFAGKLFDSRYFIWFEEVDLCREIKKLGYKVFYNPEISCVDLVGQTFNTLDSVWKQKQFTKSMLLYFQKWEPWWKWIWIWLLRPVGIGLVWVWNLLFK
jgi:hypothetical protein